MKTIIQNSISNTLDSLFILYVKRKTAKRKPYNLPKAIQGSHLLLNFQRIN